MLQNLGHCLGLNYQEIKTTITNHKQNITVAAHETLWKWFLKHENPIVAREELEAALRKAKMPMFVHMLFRTN